MPRRNPVLAGELFRGVPSLCAAIEANSGLTLRELAHSVAPALGVSAETAKVSWVRWRMRDPERRVIPTAAKAARIVAWAKKHGYLKSLPSPARALVAWIETGYFG
ncbi:MAG: hypothetical protein AMXMBFR72_11900 [Betaproteobacteria bacterium]